MMRKGVTAAVVAVLVLAMGVYAADPSGFDILAQTTEVMRSESRVMDLQMLLVNSRGQQRSRTVKVWSKAGEDGEKMLLQFLEPRDVAGTGFLVMEDDMWLYLPALRQTRRIAGHAKTGSFMGSDLSYEDMQDLITTGFSEYDAQWLATETRGGESTHKLRLTPNADSSYDYLEMWVSVETSLPRHIAYSVKGEVVKSMATEQFEIVDGRWTPTEIIVQNHVQNTRTELRIQDVNFSQTIDDALFSVRNLERGISR